MSERLSDRIRACARCGVKRRVNHNRDTTKCQSCHHAPDLPWGQWMSLASCASEAHDPEWWWPKNADSEHTALAKSICRYCPVRQICGDYAVQHKINEGIWGGLEPSQRQAVRKIRKAG